MVRKALHAMAHRVRRAVGRRNDPSDTRTIRAAILRGAAVLAGIACIALLLYAVERVGVARMQPDAPLDCSIMLFSGNARRCETALTDAYGAMPAEDRAGICEPPDMRRRFASASSLCTEYDSALIERTRGPELAEYGIAPWEREPVMNDGELRLRTASPPSSVTLVCDGMVAATVAELDGNEYRISLSGTTSGDCVLVAAVPQGSVTSKGFLMTAR